MIAMSHVDEGMVSIGGVRYREDELTLYGLTKPASASPSVISTPATDPAKSDDGGRDRDGESTDPEEPKQAAGRANKGRGTQNKAA